MVRIKRAHQNKRQELLDQLHTHTPQILKDLADYLVRERDHTLLEEVLDGLDASRIPAHPPNAQYLSKVLQPMLAKLLQLSAIARSFSHIKSKDPKAVDFIDRCLQIILDHWADVTQWMSHLLTQPPPPTHWDLLMTACQRVAYVCVDLLSPLVSEIDGNPLKEELISMPATTDLLLLLLCHTDPETGKYCDCGASNETFDLCSLFRKVWYPASTSERGREHLIERISNHLPKYQKRIAVAFVRRAQLFTETLDTEKQVNAGVLSLVQLFDTASALSWAMFFGTGTSIWTLLNRQHFLHQYTAALFKIVERAKELNIEKPAVWSSINQSTTTLALMTVFAAPNPVDVIPQVIQAGIIPCILESIPHTLRSWPPASHPFVIEPLRMFYPFLYVEKVYAALEEYGDLDHLDAWNNVASATPAEGIYEEWKALLGTSIHLFGAEREHEELRINMCSNAECPLHLERKGMGRLPPKICSACHAVTYCSEACQATDWLKIHSAECPGLTRVYHERRLAGQWTSWRTRRDQLILLQHTANEEFPGLPELKKLEAASVKQVSASAATERPFPWSKERPHYDPHLALTMVDLVTDRRLVFMPGLPIAQMNQAWWPKINGAWDHRIEACVRDMERNQDRVVLVEGKFSLDEKYVMWVFVKMEWDPEAPKEERYRIVNHAFRLGVANWGEEDTPWLFQKNKQLHDLGNLPRPGSHQP